MAPRLIATTVPELLPMKRSPGNHVSEIVNRLAISAGCFEASEDMPPQIQLEMGNSAEWAIARAYALRYAATNPGRYIHGFEVERDGIFGNIDLLDTVEFVVEDVKLTKKSLRHDIAGLKFWHNWTQVKTYCYMIGAKTGRLHIIYVNGNYKYDKGPDTGWQYRLFEDTWSEKELADNWRMVYGHRKPEGQK